jgi:hypothetical protein
MEKPTQSYYFDKIRINSKRDFSELRTILPIDELKKECRSFDIKRPYAKARTWGYLSRVEVVASNMAFLKLLFSHDSDLTPYSISYLEITQDTFGKPDELLEQELKINRETETLRKKYSGSFVYDGSHGPFVDGELYADKTHYFGGKNFKFAPYARISKLDGNPCVHGEWRIKGASIIKQKTGIASIGDLIAFRLKDFMQDMEEKYITHETINYEKFGKWLKGWQRRRKFSDREKIALKLSARTYCNFYDIKTSADLITHFRNEKIRIKSKRGRRTAFEKKILAVKYTFLTNSLL